MMEESSNTEILYKLSLNRLDAQIKTIDGIDTKIGITFGLANGLIAALIAFIAFVTKPVQEVVLIFIGLSIISYVITLIFLFFAYKYSRWSFNPNIKTLKDFCSDAKYKEYPDIIKNWVADNCIISIESNRHSITVKLRRAYFSLISLSSEGLFLAVSCFVYLLN